MTPMRWAQRVGKAETAGAKAALCAVVKKKDGDWEKARWGTCWPSMQEAAQQDEVGRPQASGQPKVESETLSQISG